MTCASPGFGHNNPNSQLRFKRNFYKLELETTASTLICKKQALVHNKRFPVMRTEKKRKKIINKTLKITKTLDACVQQNIH